MTLSNSTAALRNSPKADRAGRMAVGEGVADEADVLADEAQPLHDRRLLPRRQLLREG